MTDYHSDHIHYSLPRTSRNETILTAARMKEMGVQIQKFMDLYFNVKPKMRRRQTW